MIAANKCLLIVVITCLREANERKAENKINADKVSISGDTDEVDLFI